MLIQRKDNLMWAFPGGKVDPYEKPIDAMKREFVEEALNFTRGKIKNVLCFFYILKIQNILYS